MTPQWWGYDDITWDCSTQAPAFTGHVLNSSPPCSLFTCKKDAHLSNATPFYKQITAWYKQLLIAHLQFCFNFLPNIVLLQMIFQKKPKQLNWADPRLFLEKNGEILCTWLIQAAKQCLQPLIYGVRNIFCPAIHIYLSIYIYIYQSDTSEDYILKTMATLTKTGSQKNDTEILAEYLCKEGYGGNQQG